MATIKRFFVYPSDFRTQKPVEKALQTLDDDISRILFDKTIPADAKLALYQTALHRWSSLNDAETQKKAVIHVDVADPVAPPQPPPNPPRPPPRPARGNYANE